MHLWAGAHRFKYWPLLWKGCSHALQRQFHRTTSHLLKTIKMALRRRGYVAWILNENRVRKRSYMLVPFISSQLAQVRWWLIVEYCWATYLININGWLCVVRRYLASETVIIAKMYDRPRLFFSALWRVFRRFLRCFHLHLTEIRGNWGVYCTFLTTLLQATAIRRTHCASRCDLWKALYISSSWLFLRRKSYFQLVKTDDFDRS